jgi:hypothetical protein
MWRVSHRACAPPGPTCLCTARGLIGPAGTILHPAASPLPEPPSPRPRTSPACSRPFRAPTASSECNLPETDPSVSRHSACARPACSGAVAGSSGDRPPGPRVCPRADDLHRCQGLGGGRQVEADRLVPGDLLDALGGSCGLVSETAPPWCMPDPEGIPGMQAAGGRGGRVSKTSSREGRSSLVPAMHVRRDCAASVRRPAPAPD